VIPVYLPPGVDVACGEALLEDTVAALGAQLADPRALCLSVDGAENGAAVAERLARAHGVSTWVGPLNRGKLWAVANGVRVLLDALNPDYLAVVDADGDHFPHELPNFVRAARHITVETGSDKVLVLGRRISRHRPMGWLRGELEELADRLLLDALTYHAAVTGQPLDLEYATTLEEFPDFHSGYKLFSRATAGRVFLGEPQPSGVSDVCYWRHACEAVMVVEALEGGAYLGLVNRSTLNEQPISTFGLIGRSQLTADMIIWPCRRLGVPLPFVRQWLANRMPPLLLNTLAPQGRAELAEVRRLVLTAYGEADPDDPADLRQPLFV
jgi:hypothetical protein